MAEFGDESSYGSMVMRPGSLEQMISMLLEKFFSRWTIQAKTRCAAILMTSLVSIGS